MSSFRLLFLNPVPDQLHLVRPQSHSHRLQLERGGGTTIHGKAEVSCAMNNRLRCQNTQKFCYNSFVLRFLDHLNAMYIGITYSSRFLDMAMQWMPEQVNSRVYDIYVLFRNTVNRTSPYFIGSSVKVNIDYEHSSQDLTGHEKAKRKKGIYRIKIWKVCLWN